ncbi:uncharacterized protein CCOS01_04167 [Colletotrichum costaricense]|uniref:Uncharacterized protein n=1 Tax=Colletotrichum costaricense TaxID=1209916 RepID=A0AAI9Z293_9PEZI|nr:uncharacterized protein CCOS01_04167 [Colletotrichum costaricense]KAK1532184.1 hypothetical protein CCOS01_04167 [Colletotrichum costaricense]
MWFGSKYRSFLWLFKFPLESFHNTSPSSA